MEALYTIGGLSPTWAREMRQRPAVVGDPRGPGRRGAFNRMKGTDAHDGAVANKVYRVGHVQGPG